MSDRPMSLGIADERESRFARRYDEHVQPLNHYVDRLRREKGAGYHIPYFDPCDGGINARALFLLEAPGPQAVATGVISRNNPDPTADNMWNLQQQAGLARDNTVIWNIVPWYVGDGRRIRPVRIADIREAETCLVELLGLLPNVQIICLVGLKAQRAEAEYGFLGNYHIVRTWHTSPLVFAAHPDRWFEVLAGFKVVAARCPQP